MAARPAWLSNRPLRATALTLVTALVIVLVHLLRLDLLLLVLAPIVLALVLPMTATLAVRLVIAIGFCFGFEVIAAWLAELVRLPFTPSVAAGVVLVPIALLVGAGWLRPVVGALIDGGDAVALLAGGGLLLLLWLPTAKDSSANILARLVSDGEDNAAHLGIVQAIALQHGLLLGQASRWSGRLLAGHTAYPPAFHLNVALLLGGVQAALHTASPALLVRTYFYDVIGLQAIWAATTVMAARAVARSRQPLVLGEAVVAVAIVLFFLFGPPSELMNWGFQSQVAALWMLTFELFVATTPELDDRPLLRLSLVLVAMAGTSWSWYLVTPVAGVVAVLATLTNRDGLLARWPWSVALWLVGLVLSAPPLIYGVLIGAPGYINASGGVYFLDRVFIGLMVVAALAVVLLPVGRRAGIVITLGGLVGAGLMAAAIHWYQTRTAGTANYFYEKVLYTLVVVAAVAAAAAVLYALDVGIGALARSRWRQVGLAAMLCGVAWLATGTATYANPGRHYLTGTRMFPDVGAMQHMLVTPPPHDGRQILFWADNPTVYDYLSSRFAAGIYLRNTDQRNDFMANNAYKQDDLGLLALLHASPDGLWIMTRDPNLRARLAAAGFTDSDLSRMIIDTITEPPDWSSHRPINADISPRGLLPGLFRQR